MSTINKLKNKKNKRLKQKLVHSNLSFSSSFKTFVFELDELKREFSYQPHLDFTHFQEKSCCEKGVLNIQVLFAQLKVRDDIISKIEGIYQQLFSYSTSKITELENKLRKLKAKQRKYKTYRKKYKQSEKIVEDDGTSSVDENSMQVPSVESKTKEIKEDWTADNIAEEVKAIAGEIVENSGFTFMEDLQMYYDSSSGYYYDPKTSLYYDTPTQTYFYYDYDLQSYQFHSYARVENAVTSPYACEENKIQNSNNVVSPISKKDSQDGSNSPKSENSFDANTTTPTEFHYFSNAVYTSENEEPAPCLRLMVTNGEEKGSLHIVTLNGGTIGKETSNHVVLKDVSVSKVHAVITYKSNAPSDHHYFIQDLGSNNGTIVQKKRLSESRCESEPVEIGHGWNIQIGAVSLTCHVHPGYLTCNSCEPGLLSPCPKDKPQLSTEDKEKVRKRVNKKLKKKYIVQESGTSQLIGYNDRAHQRRKTKGSDNPYEKTEVASIDTCISENNKGFQLIEKMGWTQGQGLGAKEDGIVQPVLPQAPSFDRSGIGVLSLAVSKPSKSKRVQASAIESKNISPVSKIKFKPASIDGMKS